MEGERPGRSRRPARFPDGKGVLKNAVRSVFQYPAKTTLAAFPLQMQRVEFFKLPYRAAFEKFFSITI